MTQRTVDFEPSVSSPPITLTPGQQPNSDGSNTIAVLTRHDTEDLKAQFPNSPIIGNKQSSLMTRNSVAEHWRKVMSEDPGASDYWGFSNGINMNYRGSSFAASPPNYGIIGTGKGTPLNSFMPPMVTGVSWSPMAWWLSPKGWDDSDPRLKDYSDHMISVKPSTAYGYGEGTQLSPHASVSRFVKNSAWRSPDREANTLGKYEMGWSGMSPKPSNLGKVDSSP